MPNFTRSQAPNFVNERSMKYLKSVGVTAEIIGEDQSKEEAI